MSGCGATVAHQLPKLRVAGSNPVARSKFPQEKRIPRSLSKSCPTSCPIKNDLCTRPHVPNGYEFVDKTSDIWYLPPRLATGIVTH